MKRISLFIAFSLVGCGDVSLNLVTPAPVGATASYVGSPSRELTLTEGTSVALSCTVGNKRAACSSMPTLNDGIAGAAPAYSSVLQKTHEFEDSVTSASSIMIITGYKPGTTTIRWDENGTPATLNVIVVPQPI